MAQKVFTGRYQILSHLARGGMAEVYLARDLLLDRKVALKVLFEAFAADRSFVERFRREARAAANLNHPGIVAVYDWGEDGGTYFIVMEYVEGRTLYDILATEGPLMPDRAAEIGADIATALAFAHSRGVVHRDVKPGNVLITPTGVVKVADFGIARAGDPEERLTRTGSVLGTATYFSPEQASGQAIDARSDIYSLGVVLYEMLAGRPPFVGDNPVSIAYQHVRESPPPPSAFNPDVPPDLSQVVAKAMAKNPANRYRSAEELAADLTRFRQRRPVLAEPLMAEPVLVEETVRERRPAPTRVQRAADRTRAAPKAVLVGDPGGPSGRRSLSPYLVLMVVLLAALGVLLFFLARELGVGQGGAGKVVVPNVVGDPEATATARLQSLGLRVQRQAAPDDNTEAGRVKEQRPPDGTQLAKGATVTVVVSTGPETRPVPAVKGLPAGDAEARLTGAGFTPSLNARPDDKVPADTVLDQDPAPNTPLPKGGTVTLTVSSGPDKVGVPDVTGRSAADAANVLGRAGLDAQVRPELSPTVPEGGVIRTNPAAGTMVAKGSTVTLIVSAGAPATTTTTEPATTTTTRATTAVTLF